MRYRLLLAVVVVLPCVLWSAVPVVELVATAKEQLPRELDLLEASAGDPGIEAISDPAFDPRFRTIAATASLPSGAEVFWLRFRLHNPQDTAVRRFLDFSVWTAVDFYYRGDSTEAWRRRRTGQLVPFRQRDLGVANFNLIDLTVKPGETITCYVRLATTTRYAWLPVNFELRIWSPSYFQAREIRTRLVLSFFLGIYLIMFAYNLFIYLSTRERYYVPYLIVILAMMVILAHNYGYTIQLFADWPGYVRLHSLMELFLSQVLGIAMFLFTLWFLDVRNRYPRWQRIVSVFIGIVIFLPLPALFGYAFANAALSGLLGITAMIIINYLAIRSWWEGYPSANFFMIGYGAFTIGIIFTLLAEVGVLPREVIIQYFPINIGSAVELTFFSFALANRINVLARENERKQQEIIAQLRTNEDLQNKVNRELEQKVRERTQEINRQKEEIEQKSQALSLEMEKADDLLLNILPAATVRELKEKGEATPRYYDRVTVLFTDFRDFTRLVSTMTPQEIIRELNTCFLAFDEIVERHNLEKIKTIGDSYMCAGGVPVPNETHPADAIRAAIEMRDFIRRWNAEKESRGLPPWPVRIGIHTGELIAGVVGRKKFAFDIWGDAVNTASRMESSGEPDRINISEQTYLLTKDLFLFTYRGRISAKNKGEISMYFADPLPLPASNIQPSNPNESLRLPTD